MNHIERVHASIRHEQLDKIAKGEIGQGVCVKLEKELLGGEYDSSETEEAQF